MKKKYWILAILAPAVIIFDQWTKIIVLEKFQYGESISVLESFFNLTYVRNTGAAFGFMASADPTIRIPFFLVVPMIALGVIAWLFRGVPEGVIRLPVAFSLVVGGAIGNLIDRVRLGYVVDFLDFHWKYQVHFPAFNVADSAICVGIGLLLLDAFIKKPQEHQEVVF